MSKPTFSKWPQKSTLISLSWAGYAFVLPLPFFKLPSERSIKIREMGKRQKRERIWIIHKPCTFPKCNLKNRVLKDVPCKGSIDEISLRKALTPFGDSHHLTHSRFPEVLWETNLFHSVYAKTSKTYLTTSFFHPTPPLSWNTPKETLLQT